MGHSRGGERRNRTQKHTSRPRFGSSTAIRAGERKPRPLSRQVGGAPPHTREKPMWEDNVRALERIKINVPGDSVTKCDWARM